MKRLISPAALGVRRRDAAVQSAFDAQSYTPGRTYAISVLITHPELKRGGFQLAIRVAAGPRTGSPAGKIQADDHRVQIVRSSDGRREYAGQTEKGGIPQNQDSIAWTLKWTAPAEPGLAIVCHAAGNAANDDESALGDAIYATSAVVR